MRPQILLVTLITALLFARNIIAAEQAKAKSQTPLATLQSTNASFYDKARACQQLGEFGTREAVPALAAVLSNEKLSAYARSGLEGISHPNAAAALRNAAKTLKGNLLIGVVNSLGTLRDEKAVSLLMRLATDPSSGASAEALLALGRIANRDSLKILRDRLTKGSDAERINAAAGCLVAADMKMAQKHNSEAMELYDAVRQANVPITYRAAATHGAIVARQKKGADLFAEQLRSNERIIRNAALISIREIPSDRLAKSINTELDHAPAELQAQLLAALADCHNADSLKIAATKTTSEDAEVRKAALLVLGLIGGASEADALLRALMNDAHADEADIAQNSLGRLNGAAVDQEIIKALNACSAATARIKYIRLLERRGASAAVPDILKCAADPDTKVSVVALNASKSLAGAEELPMLISLNKSTKSDAVHDAVENAIAGICNRSARETQGGEAVLVELKQTSNPTLKGSWIKVLVALGYTNALPEILAATRDMSSSVATIAIEQLASWPNPQPIEPLLEIAQSASVPTQRKTAVLSVARLATAAAEEKQQPATVIVKWFQRADRSAQSVEERRLILSGLGRVKHIESFRLLASHLNDKTVNNEAAAAVLQIAAAVAQADPAAVNAALQKIAANSSNQDMRNQAAKLAKAIQTKVSGTQ